MLEKFGYLEKLKQKTSELSPIDKGLQERANWFIRESGIESFLKKGGQYLDVGTGKGHIIQSIMEDMGKKGSPLKAYFGMDISSQPTRKVQEREGKRIGETNSKNPMNFVRGSAEAMPFDGQSLDGVSFLFCLHHMDKDMIDKALREAIRVIKPDGNIFIGEDLVESEGQRKLTERADRIWNMEFKRGEHNFNSDRGWEEYLNKLGLEIVERKVFPAQFAKEKLQHGFYVVRRKELK